MNNTVIATANKIYKRSYTMYTPSNINGNDVLLFEGGGCKMVVLTEQYERDIDNYNKEQEKKQNKNQPKNK